MKLRLYLSVVLLFGLVTSSFADTGSRLFERGRNEYFSAKKMPAGLERDRALKNAATTLRKFLEVHQNHPKNIEALFDLGFIYENLALPSEDHDAASTAIHYFKEVVQRAPQHNLADDSLYEVAKLCMKIFQDTQCSDEAMQKIHTDYRNGDIQSQLSSLPGEINETKISISSELNDVVVDRTPSHFLVRIQLTEPHAFIGKRLLANLEQKLPERYYVDIDGVQIRKDLKPKPLLSNDPISQIRFGQNGTTARIVMDLSPSVQPSSIVTEIQGSELVVSVPSSVVPVSKVEVKKIENERVKIVIDAGHGGEDTGARGKKGTLEKDVCLAVSKRVEELLKVRKEYEVFITRPDDKYITLADRTKFANNVGGDLFVSIHANASPRKSAEGVSTYFLDNHDDAESLRVAMRENSEPLLAVSPDSPTSDSQYLEIMKASMVKNFHTVQSTEFARNVQLSLLKDLKSEYSGVQDLGVRSARFYVLTGATMPAILVETSFISNPKEEKRLSDARYQKLIARAIVRGIDQFFKSSVGKGDHAALYQ